MLAPIIRSLSTSQEEIKKVTVPDKDKAVAVRIRAAACRVVCPVA